MLQQPQNTHEVFNQSPPFENINLFTSDKALSEAVAREGASVAAERLKLFGAKAGSAEALDLGRQANENPPILKRYDQKGRRLDVVEFHPSYHRLMAMSFAEGLHSSPWDNAQGEGRHVARCAGSYMAMQMEAGHCCPITMTNASVATLRLHPGLAEAWLPKILSRNYDPAFKPATEKLSVTIGMGMTEKQGGTDVRANSTRAEPLGGGEYRITGHKWFMSAPMSDAFLILAQAPGGLSCFFLPRFLPDGTVNAIRFERLKDKLGNRSNASSEVEFWGATAWLVGEEGRGINAIIEMVTLTRLDCAVGSAGLMRLALANALHHVSYRSVFQKRLIDQPLMRAVLADMALDLEAATALVFRLARSFDRAAQDEGEAAYKRLMTPVIKYWVTKTAPNFIYEAMECLGGNGYVEEGLVARAFREAPVNAIWEGSGNVMALDVLRVMAREPGVTERVLAGLEAASGGDGRLRKAAEALRALFSGNGSLEERGREVTERLACLAAGTVLLSGAPHAVSDAFLKRLEGPLHQTYGAGMEGADKAAILERAIPAE